MRLDLGPLTGETSLLDLGIPGSMAFVGGEGVETSCVCVCVQLLWWPKGPLKLCQARVEVWGSSPYGLMRTPQSYFYPCWASLARARKLVLPGCSPGAGRWVEPREGEVVSP